jgi:hypothetical protein
MRPLNISIETKCTFNSHEGKSRDYNIPYFYLTSLTSIITSRVHQTSTLKLKYRNFIQSLSSSGKKIRSSIIDSDTTMKPIHGITRQSHYWLRTDPTARSNQSSKHTATSNQLSYLQKTHENIATSKDEYTNTQQGLPD